jgi:hypothetical protein
MPVTTSLISRPKRLWHKKHSRLQQKEYPLGTKNINSDSFFLKAPAYNYQHRKNPFTSTTTTKQTKPQPKPKTKPKKQPEKTLAHTKQFNNNQKETEKTCGKRNSLKKKELADLFAL